ncbi:yippee-domain-containing protein [Martensiomyces pterosporus]|nr:yippee-domain-containing protein [Martensiomyces pterosporus]
MGLVFQQFLECPSIYACLGCSAHIARAGDIISRTFQGRLGRAYLTEAVVNEMLGDNEDRLLMTGMHTVCNLHCRNCGTVIGWKYIRAHDKSQQYKEGRYVLEQSRIFAMDQASKPRTSGDGNGSSHYTSGTSTRTGSPVPTR